MLIFKKSKAKSVACAFLAALLLIITGCKAAEHQVVGATDPPLELAVPTRDPDAPTATPAPTDTPEPTATPKPVYTQDLFSFSGYSFCIANLSTGSIIFETNGDSQCLIASITKLLTALTAMDYFKTDDTITAKEEYFELLRKDASIDAYGIKAGQTFSVSDLLKLLLLKSYADAALMLQNATEEIAGKDFIGLMNEKAQSLGMVSSHFDNSIGLDTGNGFTENYSTAEDVVRLLIASYKNADIASVASLYSAKISDGTTVTNTNLLLGTQYASSLYTAYAGKTGSTNAAGVNVASTFISSTGTVYAVVYLHGSSSPKMYEEVRGMVEYVINNNM